MGDTVVRLKPQFYVHIQDNNSNLTLLLSGPTTYTLQQHQSLLFEPRSFIVVPPQHYAVIENPVDRDKATGELTRDRHGQTKVLLGERDVRFTQEPFPLYPGEVLIDDVRPLVVLSPLKALVLRALRTFTDANDVERSAGDEYLFRGPGTYTPRPEEEIVERRDATVIKFNEALQLRAKNAHTDPVTGVRRQVGEEYLRTERGTYMVGVDETLVAVVAATTLTQQKALHVEVLKLFTDRRPWAKGVVRRPGQVYLVTNRETSEFIPDPAERVVVAVPLITVTRKQWAVLLDPVEDGVQQLGRRKVVTNTALFLQPGERLEDGVRDVYVLSEDEALLLTALEEFSDADTTAGGDGAAAVRRVAGELWLLNGPREYFPTASVRVVKDKKTGSEKRSRIVLPDGEGVYVRNTQTGEVRAVIGQTFMLAATEELWEKDVPAVVEDKLASQGNSHTSYMEVGAAVAKRDKTKVVKYLLPTNSVCQVYDYKKRSQRTVCGPEAVLLGPEEQFTLLSLSGSEWDPKNPMKCLPKKTGFIQAVYLYLGPSSLSDVVVVETLDHARLSVQLSYDWHFDVDLNDKSQLDECFKIPDFVGDTCSCVASRVRAAVAAVPFDTFHKHSNSIVTTAVFGGTKKTLRFPSNRLVVTSVDIQEIEVVDERTRDALQQSVKMAIEITTQSQEAAARQEASEREQQAKGKLERQQIEDRAATEVERKKMLQIETKCAAIASTGRAKAEARARAEASEIGGDSAVAVARIKAQTSSIMDQLRVQQEQKKGQQELAFRGETNSLEVELSKALTGIESAKFGKAIHAIGRDTVTAMARSGPEMQARMLKGLGLEGFLVTDGTNPINLFNTAKGITAAPQQ